MTHMILNKIGDCWLNYWPCQGHASSDFYVVILTDPGWWSQKAGIFWRHQRFSFRTSPVRGQLCKSWRSDKADRPWLFPLLLHQPGINLCLKRVSCHRKKPLFIYYSFWVICKLVKLACRSLILGENFGKFNINFSLVCVHKCSDSYSSCGIRADVADNLCYCSLGEK